MKGTNAQTGLDVAACGQWRASGRDGVGGADWGARAWEEEKTARLRVFLRAGENRGLLGLGWRGQREKGCGQGGLLLPWPPHTLPPDPERGRVVPR